MEMASYTSHLRMGRLIMDPGQIIELVATGIGSVALWLLNDAVAQLRGLGSSISKLNEQIAVVISRIDSHETRIDHLERKDI